MKELLEKLKSLDPTTYERYIGSDLVSSDQPEYISAWILTESAKMAWLQACVQDAISGKGWPYQIAYYPPEGPTKWFYRAYLWPEIKCVIEQSDSPAKSLLAAYIAACEAMT